MKKIGLAIVIFGLLTSACSTAAKTTKEQTREEVKGCIKEMRADDNIQDVFEVCRQIYGMKKVKEIR